MYASILFPCTQIADQAASTTAWRYEGRSRLLDSFPDWRSRPFARVSSITHLTVTPHAVCFYY